MKKIIAFSFLSLSAGIAAAQTNVTIYGVVDTGVEYVTNANAAGQSLVRLPTQTGSTPSRLGFKGSEDLGDGYRALFVLENGLALDTGASQQGGRLFGRQAYVGIDGPYGTVTLGRIYNMTFLSLLDSDILGGSIHEAANMDPYLPNARSDNAIGYLGKFSAVTVGATYSFGRDTATGGGPAATNCAGELAGDSKACRQWTTMLKYDLNNFGAAAAFDRMNGNTGASAPLSNSAFTDTRTSLNGYYKFGDAKIGLGWVGRKVMTTTNANTDLFFLGLSYRFSPAVVLDTQIGRLSGFISGNNATQLASRLTYSLSTRTSLYVSGVYLRNQQNSAVSATGGSGATPGAGVNQAAAMAGVRHRF
ncbi:porin [Herminiimonas contaminans]|uniref:Porin n=1 Tax=Herminiimonas contaminans TaxID=1111140 RepID=A0ABS0ETS3_9BURK|nr:porin [Herminiimonas contaminans]MBF8178211.1 porin [Herminiimonas contaminans]